MNASVGTARNAAYFSDESEVLISKSTWPLKLSGLLFAGLLVIGRSASYGNVTWTPSFHAAESPLIVQLAGSRKPAPAIPNLGISVPAVMTKAAVAEEVVAFHPGNSGDGEDGNGDKGDGNKSASGGEKSSHQDSHDHDSDVMGSGNTAAGSGHGSANGATTVNETSTSAAVGSGHGSGAASAGNPSSSSAAQGSGHGSGAASVGNPSATSAAQGSGNGSGERRVGKECQSVCRSRWSPYH